MTKVMNLTLGDPYIWREWYTEQGIDLTSGVNCLYLRPWDDHPGLRALIDRMHGGLFGGQMLVTGLGATQVTIGVMYALTKVLDPSISFWEQAPRYMNRKPTVEMMGYRWHDDPDVEFVTCPNNPDGSIRSPITRAKYIIWDGSYSWPVCGYDHQTIANHMIQATQGRILIPIMTFSKVLGLAGQRLGYAFIPSGLVPSYNEYCYLNSLGTSRPGYDQCLAIASISNIFPMSATAIHGRLEARYDWVYRNLGAKIPGLQARSRRGFPYLWLYLPGQDLYRILQDLGVQGIAGQDFGTTNEYTRLSLMVSSSIIAMI